MAKTSQIVESIKNDLDQIDENMIDAQEMIDIAREAGEDVSGFESELKSMNIKKEKWKRAINNRS